MNARTMRTLGLLVAVAGLAGCPNKKMADAYVYGFPMVANYKAMYQLNVDKTSGQYKGPFNQIHNDAQVFTYKDTSIVTPNSDTPYSMLQMDLRAEPMVICVPQVGKTRYYSVQLVDMYTFNYGYMGSRATGNDAGCFMVAGPGWNGATPSGIKQVFRAETQFSLAIFRTQLFSPDDIDNVKKIQAGYTAQPLSAFAHLPAPNQPPLPDFPKFTEASFKKDFPDTLAFLLQFCPPPSEETALRAKLAEVGIEPGKPFDFSKLSEMQKIDDGEAMKDAFASIEKRRDDLGKSVNGWRVASAFGDRSFYDGDYLLRASAALAGIYGNDAVEAMYPMTTHDEKGEPLDGHSHNYTLTFAPDGLPPVNAFWSVTMYDGKTQLLIENPINRYLINSLMLPSLARGADGSLTLYIQKDMPAADKKANWLPAPDGPIYLVMRLYWPKETPPSILPAGSGTWQPPPVVRVE